MTSLFCVRQFRNRYFSYMRSAVRTTEAEAEAERKNKNITFHKILFSLWRALFHFVQKLINCIDD